MANTKFPAGTWAATLYSEGGDNYSDDNYYFYTDNNDGKSLKDESGTNIDYNGNLYTPPAKSNAWDTLNNLITLGNKIVDKKSDSGSSTPVNSFPVRTNVPVASTGMSTGMKVALIGGGLLVLTTVMYFALRKK